MGEEKSAASTAALSEPEGRRVQLTEPQVAILAALEDRFQAFSQEAREAHQLYQQAENALRKARLAADAMRDAFAEEAVKILSSRGVEPGTRVVAFDRAANYLQVSSPESAGSTKEKIS